MGKDVCHRGGSFVYIVGAIYRGLENLPAYIET